MTGSDAPNAGPSPLSASPADSPTLAERLIVWQRGSGRHHLPWQGTRDPYRVWLSEVMLQQTQVATVLGYYARFLERFPDVQALAAAPLDDVLAAWSGLGYYSRARNLHRCAQAVVQRHGGRFPESAAGLEALPGIGRSTAAAIAAFCFGERVAILDGNVKRVLARVLAFEGDLSSPAALQALWRQAEAQLPDQDIEAYTQGLMDLGATRCHRRRPDCAACPWETVCAAHAQGREDAFPVKTRRLVRGRRRDALLWLRQGRRQWLVQRPATGVWAGLWSLPAWEDPSALEALVSGWPGTGEALPPIDHALTHRDWRLEPLRWTLPARLPAPTREALEAALVAAAGPGRWVDDEALAGLGLPAPLRKLLGAGR
jgi:A/G-specific adenine glycosylase